MPQVNLKKLFGKRGTAAGVIEGMARALGETVVVSDAQGGILYGDPASAPGETHRIQSDGVTIGWVQGNSAAALAAAFLSYASKVDGEKRQLADEVLAKYRELNSLYSLSEKLAACANLTDMAQIVIDEARSLISATAGTVLIHRPQLEAIATYGQNVPIDLLTTHLIARIADTGKADIVNNLSSDPRFNTMPQIGISSFLYAPLKAGKKISGLMLLYHDQPVMYSAADLMLLVTLSTQAATVFEHALQYEEQIGKLEAELKILRVEIDQAKRSQDVQTITQSNKFKRLAQQAREIREDPDS
jgi:adenylate cyclase